MKGNRVRLCEKIKTTQGMANLIGSYEARVIIETTDREGTNKVRRGIILTNQNITFIEKITSRLNETEHKE